MTPSRSPLRLARGSVAATLATVIALGGHLVGGGATPSWLGIALPWWLSVAACTVLAGSRSTVPRMAAAMLTSQALFHGLFLAGTPADPSARLVAPPGAHLGHGAHLAQGGHLADTSAHTAAGHAAEQALHAGHGDLRMLGGHVLAALLTAVLLHCGESMALGSFALAARLLHALRRPWVPVAAPASVLPAPAQILAVRVPVRPAWRAVLSPQLRRGPPLVLAA